MTRRPRVVITDCDHGNVDRELALLSSRFEVTVAQCRTEDDVLAAATDADAVICQYAPITERVLAGLHRCRVVARYGVGVDTIDAVAAERRGIWVANVPDYGIEEVADHALALSLSLLRGVHRLSGRVRAGEWDYRSVRPLHRISTLTVGVIGHGRIGANYAAKVRALGARVLVADVRTLDPAELTPGVVHRPLDELLTDAHLVSVHIPSTLGGRPLLGARELGLMRPGAYLVNTARGSLVDQSALLSAVRTGALAGAALDVLGTEPPTDTRLLADDRIIVTPHIAWYSEEAFRILKDEVAYEVMRVLDGREPRSPVNDVRRASRRA